MGKTVISNRQGICLIILFMSGSSLVLSSAKEAERDIWIAVIMGLVIAFLIVAMYSRILLKFPNKNLYEIIVSVFGRVLGSVINLIFIFYTLYLGALVLVNFSMFIGVVGLEYTPQKVVAFTIIILVIYGVKKGIEVLGRWSEFFARIIYPIIIIVTLLMLIMVDVNNFKPILANGIKPVLEGTFSIVTFPFAEIIVFTLIFNSKSISGTKNIYRTFLSGFLLGGILVSIISVVSFVALGPYAYNSSYFPIYSAVSRINIKDILQRIEIIIAVTFLIGGFIKLCVCVLACSNGFVSLLKLKDYKFIVTPVSLIILIVSLTTYKSMMEMVTGVENFKYFAILVQLILPLFILFAIEIKLKFKKNK